MTLIFPDQAFSNFEESSFISQVKDGFEKTEEKIELNYKMSFNSIDIDMANNIIRKAVAAADDYIQYNIKNWKIEITGNNNQVDIFIDVDYYSNTEEYRYLTEKIDEILSNITTSYMNDHKKVKKITDYIAKNIRYDESKQKYSAYDALIGGESTCQGYALVTYIMLKEAGIENYIISGVMGGDRHAWNLLNLDGYYYHLDLTQISTHYQQYEELMYNEYLVSDSALSLKYSWDYGQYPEADKSYYTQLEQGLKYNDSQLYQELIDELKLFYLQDKYTVDTLYRFEEIVKDTLRSGKEQIKLRITDNSIGQADIKKVINEIFSENDNIASKYQQWRYNIFPYYIRDGIEDSSLITINFIRR